MTHKITLTLPERLDISQADAIKDRMDKALSKKSSRIEVKAENVEYVDSAGIQLLLSFKMAGQQQDIEMTLSKPSEKLQLAAELLGATELLTLQ